MADSITNSRIIECDNAPRRIASLDFTRGFAIFLMTFFHGFHHVFDPEWFIQNPGTILEVYHPMLVGLVGFLVYLGTWNSFFLLISITVNTYVMVTGARKGANLEKMLMRRIITIFFLFLADFLIEAFLYYGYFGNAIRTGGWQDPSRIWLQFFTIRTLEIIAWSLLITTIINYFLLKYEGFKRIKRNLIIYGFLAIAILSSTHFVHQAVDNINWAIPPENPDLSWPNALVQEYNISLKSWMLVRVAGKLEPFFPYLTTAFFGAMVGFTISLPKPPRRTTTYYGTTGLLFMVIGVILMVSGLPTSFAGRSSLSFFFLQIGGQLGLLMLFFRRVEFKGRGKVFADNWFAREMRRWSMVSLSIYALEVFDLLPAAFLNLIVGQFVGYNFLIRTFNQPNLIGYALLYAIYSLSWYLLLIWLWSKISFKGSLEWILLKIQSLFTKYQSHRLNTKLILYDMHWIVFTEKISNIKYPWYHKLKNRTKPEQEEIPP